MENNFLSLYLFFFIVTQLRQLDIFIPKDEKGNSVKTKPSFIFYVYYCTGLKRQLL